MFQLYLPHNTYLKSLLDIFLLLFLITHFFKHYFSNHYKVTENKFLTSSNAGFATHLHGLKNFAKK